MSFLLDDVNSTRQRRNDGSSRRSGDLKTFGNPERLRSSISDRQRHDYREDDGHRRQAFIAPAA
jgi:hypothetical protein